MKAMLFTKYGSADFIKLHDIAIPSPKENEVLVKVHAASINSWDYEVLMGRHLFNRIMFGLLRPKKLNILGCDVAGKIVAIGAHVKQFAVGDEVFGDLSDAGWGGFAEYVCAPEHTLVLKPNNITYNQAAALPQASLLALQGLRDKAQLHVGQKVLINGAGGGVGTFALQLAKCFGAEVTGVDYTNKLDIMRLTGADEVIDCNKEDFTKNGLHYDLILDIAANHSISDYKKVLSSNGQYLMVGGSNALATRLMLLGPLYSLFDNVSMGLLLYKTNKGLDFISDLARNGKIVPVIDRTYPLNELAKAMKYFQTGEVVGKLVIQIDDEFTTE